MRLWRQLALVMALLATVPAGVLGALAISTVDEEWRRVSERRVRRDARRQADELGDWLSASRALVAEVPESFASGARETFSAREWYGLQILAFRIVEDAELVVMVDSTGRVLEPQVPAEATDEQVAALVARLPPASSLRAGEDAQVGNAWASVRGPAVPVAVQVAEDRFLGMQLAMRVPGDSLDNPQGLGLLREDGEPLLASSPLVQPAQLTPLLGVFEEFETDEPEPAHGALARVPGSPGWTLVVVEPERALLRLSERITQQILVGGLVATLVGVLAALGTALTVSRPIERLRSRALQLADGALGIRVGIERNDEIGELGTAFDHLSTRLQANQARIAAQQTEIEAFNVELQRRVDEQTQELREAQDQLVRTSQRAAVAQLGAGLAHDLNNPLTGVLGIAQVLRDRHPTDSLIASLEKEAQRCRDVVSAMQRATTLEVDPARAVTIDLQTIVRRAAEWVAPAYAQRGVGLVTTGAHTDLQVTLVPEHATSILAQILQSVRSGLPEGSSVTVQVTIARSEGAPRDRPAVRIEADRKVAEQPQHRDDWLAASRVMWVTVQLIDRLGGDLHRPEEGRVWQWVL